nr:PEBP [Andraca theae]
MVWKSAFLLLAVGSLTLARGESVEEAFEAAQIVPDYIPTAPQCSIQVEYTSGVEADLGNELTPTQVKDMPTVTYDADPDKFYTLALVDHDAPSRESPTLAEFLHWSVGNIPGNKVADGETLAEYIGSAAPAGTGFHRYVFLLYEQPKSLCFDEPRLNNTSMANRTMFSIYDFSEKYEFGSPKAGNFYLAQYDEYVDVLTAQLNG